MPGFSTNQRYRNRDRAVALVALGGISVSYGAGAGAMAAVSSLRIHAFYDTQQQLLIHYQMVKVSIEVHDRTARFAVAVKAKSIRQAVSIVSAQHPSSPVKVKFSINPESFVVEDSAA